MLRQMQDSCRHCRGVEGRHICDSERSHNLLDGIIQGLADLVCEDFAYPFKIPSETHPVFLDVLVAHLSHEIVQDAVFLAEVDDFHSISSLNPYKVR